MAWSIFSPSKVLSGTIRKGIVRKAVSAIIETLETRLHLSVSQDANGFTVVTPSADSRIVYVSSSSGSDSNSGLTQQAPVATLAKAKALLRSGMPDEMLLKRGDVWNEAVGGFSLRGRSANEPLVLGSYGDTGDRPLVRSGTATGLTINGGWPDQSYLVIQGIHFQAQRSGSEDATAISWTMGSRWALIEDCYIDGYRDGITFVGGAGNWEIDNVTIRRNVIVDNFSINAHSQGIFADSVHGLDIEENILDHNGWKEGVAGAEPTMFNHNVYLTVNDTDVTFANNISLRASSHGAQVRPGGLVSDNFFWGNPVALMVGNGSGVLGPATVSDNVILGSSDMAGMPRGFGIDLNVSLRNFSADGNIVANVASGAPGVAFSIDPGAMDGTVSNNILYNWGNNTKFDNQGINVTLSSNQLGGGHGYADGARSPLSYNSFQGGPGTIDGFIAAVRQQSRFNWNPAYTAAAINTYIRSGFASGFAASTVVSIAATTPTTAEGSSTPGVFTVSRTGSAAADLTVNYSIRGTASNGVDYAQLDGSVTILAGAASAPITILPIDDALVESTENVSLSLLPNPTYSLGAAAASVTITDNEALPAVSVVATTPGAAEDNRAPGIFTISRTGDTSQALVVTYTMGGSAGNGVDYNQLGGSAILPAGAASATVSVVPIDDLLVEGDERVLLNIASSSNYTIGAAGSDVVTIADNDTAASTVFSPTPYLGDAANYTTLNPARWQVASDGGDLRLSLATTDYSGFDGGGLGEYALINDHSFGDFAMTLSARSPENFVANPAADYAVVFGYVDPSNYNYMLMNEQASLTQLFTVVDGQRQLVATASVPGLADGDYHAFSLTRKGSAVAVQLDCQPLLSVSDSRLATKGAVGVGSYNDAVYFDDIAVAPPAAGVDAPLGFGTFVLLNQNMGRSNATAADGDLNHDGVVDFQDLTMLFQGFGTGDSQQ